MPEKEANGLSDTSTQLSSHRQDRAGDTAVDRAVAELQRGGDADACFRVVFDRYNAPLMRFFLRKGFPRDDCLDLTQETFVGIYRGVQGFRREARFETWVYKVARTTYLKRLRREAAAKRAAIEIPLDSTADKDPGRGGSQGALDVLEAEQRREIMRQEITRLPEKMRRCLILRIYQDLSYREIATVMRLKIDTVKAHLFQARKRLEQRLGPGPALREIGGGPDREPA